MTPASYAPIKLAITLIFLLQPAGGTSASMPAKSQPAKSQPAKSQPAKSQPAAVNPPVVRPQEAKLAPVVALARDPASITHLPESLQRDIESWRGRLQNARCLKVVCDTDERWVNEYDLSPSGAPTLVAQERFCIHSWMTPSSSWVVIFPCKADGPDTSRTLFQQYWNAREGQVWVRAWDESSAGYRVLTYPCDGPAGPESPHFDARGCIYAGVTQSWLAGPADLLQRPITVASVALCRQPNLAIVPPDPSQPGTWLDVFRDTIDRNQEKDPRQLYRRSDFMLLARNDQGLPELREWRTIVTADETDAGRKPQRITGIRRFAYTFFDREPPELKSATDAFLSDFRSAQPAPPTSPDRGR